MNVFEISKRFPKEEKFSLTDQIRRCTRSVCTNLAGAYRRRKYRANFLSKYPDSDSENSETQAWLMFAHDCVYISKDEFIEFNDRSLEAGRIIDYMIDDPDKF